MNRPDKPGEPSMEEILASIRQIIADDPSNDQTEPAIEANPLVPQSQSPASKAPEPRAPLADRLSSVLKNGPLPPTSPLGSKRPLSFDQDLADMFDEQEPADGSPVAAPKPDFRGPAGLSHPMAAKPFVPMPKPDSAKPLADGAAALPPQLARPESFVPPPPFGSPDSKATETPPPETFGFPPLRKTSFYPPQPKAPVTAPPPSQADALARAPEPKPASVGIGAPTAPSTSAETFARRDEPGPAVPSEAAPAPAVTVAPAREATGAPAETRTEDRSAQTGPAPSSVFGSSGFGSTGSPAAAAAAASPSAPAPQPASGSFGSFGSAAPITGAPPTGAPPNAFGAPQAASARPDPAPYAPAQEKPVEPRPFPESLAAADRVRAAAPGAFSSGQSPRLAPEPDPTSVAAHQALDALAQGLAASAAASTSSSAADVSPAIPLTPVVEPEREFRTAPQPSNLPAPVPPAASAPAGRTLEDAVADMLRPMLQQWVADNMPRIIERALRTEVAKSMPPGQKPPGS